MANALRVNDLFYLANPFPAAGDNYASITGILEYRNGNSKIEPRGMLVPARHPFGAGAHVIDIVNVIGSGRVGSAVSARLSDCASANSARAASNWRASSWVAETFSMEMAS